MLTQRRITAFTLLTLLGACGGENAVLKNDEPAADVSAALVAATNLPVYAEGLGAPFIDASDGMHTLYATAAVHDGNYAIELDPSNHGTLKLHAVAAVTTSTYGALDFWVHGGATGGQSLTVSVLTDATATTPVSLASFAAISANAWTHVSIPFTSLAVSGGNITDIVLRGSSTTTQSPVFFDTLSLVIPSAVSTLVVFDDQAVGTFKDAGWGAYSAAQTTVVHTGTTAVSLNPNAWDGVQFTTSPAIDLTATGYTGFVFWIHGGANGNQTLWVGATTQTGGTYRVPVSNYLSQGVPANAWAQVSVPFADLGITGQQLLSIYVMDATGKSQSTVYFDDFLLVGGTHAGAGTTTGTTTGSTTGTTTTGSTTGTTGAATTTTGGASTTTLPIFDDKVQNAFKDTGWGSYSVTQTSVVHSGTTAVSLNPNAWAGVQFTAASAINLATSNYLGYTFWINGGKTGNQTLWAGATTKTGGTYRVLLTKYLPSGIPANIWAQITVPFADLGITGQQLLSIYVMDAKGTTQPTVYFDDFALVGTAGTGATTTSSTTGGSVTTGGSTTTGSATTTGGGTTTGGAAHTPGWLYTAGNRIYNSDGSLFHGRGANIADPRGCGSCTGIAVGSSTAEVIRRIDALVDGWKANFLRLDLESYSSGSLGVLSDPNYLAAIQQVVAHVQTKPNVYVVLSVWVDPSLDANGWPTATTDLILAKLATTFANTPQVLFGIANEPQNNYDGSEDSTVWQRMNAAATSIRAAEAVVTTQQHIVLAQGTGGWSRFLAYYEAHPLTAGGGQNYAYEVHVYDVASTFTDRFVTPSKTIPVVIGEFGPVSGSMTSADCATLMPAAEAAGVPWLAWTFHMRCPPNLLVDNSSGGCGVGMTLSPSSWGAQVQAQLAKPWGS